MNSDSEIKENDDKDDFVLFYKDILLIGVGWTYWFALVAAGKIP